MAWQRDRSSGKEKQSKDQGIPYKWLFSRVVYLTNGPSFSILRILISRMAAGDHIFLILMKYFRIFHELSLYQRNS